MSPDLEATLAALREWQDDAAPFQLHPGDVGWLWRFGAAAVAAATEVWRRDGEIVAVGMADGPDLLRLGIAPAWQQDPDLARQLAAELPAQIAYLEVPRGAALREVLGWRPDESWTPLRRTLAGPVEEPALRVEVVGPHLAEDRAAVQTAAFATSTFSAERWQQMAAGPAYADARCLVAYDDGLAVAAATVWSAGPGRPGLLEPVGVHRDHRRRGHGRAITLAAAAALRELGASSATVCTPSSNTAGVAAYEAAGFARLAERRDLAR